MTKPVLVTGAAGQLGAVMVRTMAGDGVIAWTRRDVDLQDADAVLRGVERTAPAAIINCAAYNDVDGAQDDPSTAMAVNAFAVRTLARAAELTGATLVHFSTDFVFDGTASVPYREDDKPAPRSVYAQSKLLGEMFALEAPGALVLRVESLFGSPPDWQGRRGTLDSLVEGIRDGRELRVFTDRVVSPSYIPDVAGATRHLIARGMSGLYHCVNSGSATWAEVAGEAAHLLGRPDARLVPTRAADVVMKASRPLYCALDNSRLAAAGCPMPPWQDALRRWLLAGEARP